MFTHDSWLDRQRHLSNQANMRDLLEEVHNATMQNERTSEIFSPLCQGKQEQIITRGFHPWLDATPLTIKSVNLIIYLQNVLAGEKLCVIVWDAWEILVQRSANHRHSKASYSTKHKMNAYHR